MATDGIRNGEVENGPRISSDGTDDPAPHALVIEGAGAGSVTLPEGISFGNAAFTHTGPDLMLTGPDGTQVTIRDFFDGDALPHILTAAGGMLPGATAARLSGRLAPGQYAQAAPAGSAEPIGQVDNVDGTVTAIHADGTRVALKIGDPVFQGDVLETADHGGIGIVLADETTFSMAENGRAVLDEVVYDSGTQDGNIGVSVLTGVFTFVSGHVAKVDPDAMVLQTPAATVGIRGTQVGLDVPADGPMKIVLMEEADGFVGEVIIQNNAGVQILNHANQGVFFAGVDVAPSTPVIFDADEIGDAFGGALSVLPTAAGNGNNYGVYSVTKTQIDDGAHAAAIENSPAR
jgi:hypothetical protein